MDNRMMAFRARTLLCIIALFVFPAGTKHSLMIPQTGFFLWSTVKKPPQFYLEITTGDSGVDVTVADEQVPADSVNITTIPECREEQFPCTRLYSVHKPVKQCIRYLCVTSVRRMYIINKEVCSRMICKEDEFMQDEICRQLAGLPPRRMRRSGQPRGPPCQWAKNKELNNPAAP